MDKHSMDKHSEDDLFGLNRRLYRKPKEEPQVKKPETTIFLPGHTEFLVMSEEDEAYEPVFIPKHNILEETLKREVESLVFAQNYINQIVYDSKDASPYTKDVDASMYGLDALPYYLPKSRDDTVLIFESRFECGNLRRVIQKCDYEYNLILENDTNTNGHTQWYFFSVANTRKNVEYRYNIINLLKPDSLYNVGMKPLVYSEKNAHQKKTGWLRAGADICYYAATLKRKNGGYYSSLSFTLKFDHDCDTVYIAHCYPYTYTQLQRYLKNLECDNVRKNRYQRRTLCVTEGGNNCDYISIGESNATKDKRAIILTARVHPGETMSSYIIEYIIDFLLGNTPTAKFLRDTFVFKIVPMLNIDGVVVGNYRCNLSGADLNRQWIEPTKKLHPSIYFTKILIRKTKEERDLAFCCDIHGHNRKKNIFIYGCSGKDPSKKEQVFPMLMKNNCAVFNFKDCCFQVQKDREGAARIALWKQLSIVNCFTLEVSFCGSDFGKYEFFHYNPSIYKEIAHAFCHSLEDYYEPSQLKYKRAADELESYIRNSKLDENNKQSSDSDYSGDENQIISNARENKLERQGRDSKDNKLSLERDNRDNTGEKNNLIKKKLPATIKNKKK